MQVACGQKCTTMSQVITGSLWWASPAISYWYQMGVCIWRWEGKRQMQTDSWLAAHNSWWGPHCLYVDTNGYRLTVDMCQADKWDWYCVIDHPQNINMEIGNGVNLWTLRTTHCDRGRHVAAYVNCQAACESLWTWRWSLSSPDAYSGWDMEPFI